MSTLTPVLNEERHVRATVAALQRQDVQGEAEFLFIDGRSTDATRALLEELAERDPRIRLFDNPARHTASALNIGLRAARGAYVARIDAHTAYPAHYLSKAIARLQAGDVDWVAGPQIPVGRNPWSRRVAKALGSRLATGASNRWSSDIDRQDGEVELDTGVFTGVWRRETLDRHGGWDEGWPINQDSELAARVHEDGGRIVSLPSLGASYTPRRSLGALARQYWRYGMYRAKTILRHPWCLRRSHVALAGFAVTAGGAVLAPRPARRAARGALAVYGVITAIEGARAGAGSRSDVLGVPVVFVTMHASWGAGFLAGIVRFVSAAHRRPALATDLMARAANGVG